MSHLELLHLMLGDWRACWGIVLVSLMSLEQVFFMYITFWKPNWEARTK